MIMMIIDIAIFLDVTSDRSVKYFNEIEKETNYCNIKIEMLNTHPSLDQV